MALENRRELRWLGKTEGDTVNGGHSFMIKPTGQNSVHFTHSEKFTDSMVAALEGWLDTFIRSHFDEMKSAESQSRTELVFLSSVTRIMTGTMR